MSIANCQFRIGEGKRHRIENADHIKTEADQDHRQGANNRREPRKPAASFRHARLAPLGREQPGTDAATATAIGALPKNQEEQCLGAKMVEADRSMAVRLSGLLGLGDDIDEALLRIVDGEAVIGPIF